MRLSTRLATALFAVAAACTTATTPHRMHHARRPVRDGADEFQRMILSDENGRIPIGAYARALAQSAALAKQPQPDRAGVSRSSWTWPGPGNVGVRITTMLLH